MSGGIKRVYPDNKKVVADLVEEKTDYIGCFRPRHVRHQGYIDHKFNPEKGNV